MSEYQIKKNLRRGACAKSYAQIEEQIDIQEANINISKKQYEVTKESIFDHKGWSVKERVKLLVFLSYYQRLPDWSSQRKSIHLYKHLSNFLKKTRTPEQCKNIHSLLKRKHQTMLDIIEFIQDKLEAEENYERFLQKYQNQIKKFEATNNLFGDCHDIEGHDLTFPRPKSVTQRDEPLLMLQEQRISKTMRQNTGIAQIRFRLLKREEGLNYEAKDSSHAYGQNVLDTFAKKRRELIDNCNFYFMEWLKCAKMLEHASETKKDK